MQTIYTIAITNVDQIYHEVNTEMSYQSFLSLEDAKNGLVRLAISEMRDSEIIPEEEIRTALDANKNEFVFQYEEDMYVIYKIVEVHLYEDQIDYLASNC